LARFIKRKVNLRKGIGLIPNANFKEFYSWEGWFQVIGLGIRKEGFNLG